MPPIVTNVKFLFVGVVLSVYATVEPLPVKLSNVNPVNTPTAAEFHDLTSITEPTSGIPVNVTMFVDNV